MSLKDARKFVVDFEADPNLRIRLAAKKEEARILKKSVNEMDLLFSIAKERGYIFSVNELKEAYDNMSGAISDDELLNVAGGVDFEHLDLPKIPKENMRDILNANV